jgi:hypothetical protein
LTRPCIEHLRELEGLRRSIAMLQPQAWRWTREKAMRLIRELKEAEERLKRLRTGRARLLAEDEQPRS